MRAGRFALGRQMPGFAERRGSRQSRGYGAAWDRLRVAVLRRDAGICQCCLKLGRITLANEVDHIRNKAQGGSDDMDNLQAICRACHAAKTAAESAAARGADLKPSPACTASGIPIDPAHPWVAG